MTWQILEDILDTNASKKVYCVETLKKEHKLGPFLKVKSNLGIVQANKKQHVTLNPAHIRKFFHLSTQSSNVNRHRGNLYIELTDSLTHIVSQAQAMIAIVLSFGKTVNFHKMMTFLTLKNYYSKGLKISQFD